MRKLTANDINSMFQQQVKENLQVTAGKGKKKKIIIAPGFKIMHLKSGLTYTVDTVKIIKGKPVIIAHGGDGTELELHPNHFKDYKGL